MPFDPELGAALEVVREFLPEKFTLEAVYQLRPAASC
ncbi:MAG: hypothetical protein JWN00_5054 [Actinomycetia bacterium]|nr:hypothetical protein [Actinomycetes bacterium]